jgi:hypothetical protein
MVLLQFGASGPFEWRKLSSIEEVSQEEADKMGYGGIG